VTLEGVVESRNDTGIRLNGEWINRSKFRPVELPEVGTHVRAEVDGKGYLKSVDVLGQLETHDPVATVRLAVLQAAATFAAPRADIKSADVLTIADRWLAWVEDQSADK